MCVCVCIDRNISGPPWFWECQGQKSIVCLEEFPGKLSWQSTISDKVGGMALLVSPIHQGAFIYTHPQKQKQIYKQIHI